METLNINYAVYRVSDFLDWQRNHTLQLSPSFQRRPVWRPAAKSYLIDTIVRGLPIPVIFIRETTDLDTLKPIRQVVDGQQRIRTLLTYIAPKLIEDYLESRDNFEIKAIHNKAIAGKRFMDLSSEYKEQILNYKFGVHILPPNVDDKQVLQIFARMNATGVRLNYQELRNATFTGELKQTMYDLAYEQLSRWRDWQVFNENNIARMEEVEFVSDLALLMFKGITSKSKKPLDKMYEDNEDVFVGKLIIETRFRNVMDAIDTSLGRHISSTIFKKKTLFYCLFALVYDYLYSLNSTLVRKSKKQLPRKFTDFALKMDKRFKEEKVPEKVLSSTSTRVSTVTSRKMVFNYLKRSLPRG